MTRILILAVAVFGYLYYQKEKKSQDFAQKLAYQKEVSSATDPCFEKEFCLQAYVAPWCSACHSLQPQMVAFHKKFEKSKSIGMKVYVGQERETGGNQQIAAPFGKSALIDQDSSAHERLKIRHYPTFFLLDRTGNTLKKDQEAFAWMMERLQ